jgi:thiamine biosynthesis lipoprotein ApbE
VPSLMSAGQPVPGGIGVILLVGALAASPAEDTPRAPTEQLHRMSHTTMGSELGVQAYARDSVALSRVVAEGFAAVDALDARWSLYRPESELSRLNRRASSGEVVAIEPDLFELLQVSAEVHRMTGGAFDVTVGPLVRLWGFLEGRPHWPRPEELEACRRRTGFDQLELDPAARTLRFRQPAMELDLGGIAKGYVVDLLAARLRRAGVERFLVDFGGSSQLASGSPPGQAGWYLYLRPTWNDRLPMRKVVARDLSISTSGNDQRFWVRDGQIYGHVLDPRTGLPTHQQGSVSVMAASATLSDALSTAFLVMGPEQATRLVDAHPEWRAVFYSPRDGWREIGAAPPPAPRAELTRLRYNHPGLVVDLGVGLWATPLPMDYDGDGDLDLVVVCSGKPYNGTYVFENPGGGPMPIFKPGRRIGPGPDDAQVSYVDGTPRVLVPGHEYVAFRASGLERRVAIYPEAQVHKAAGRVRANQWKYADWDGDGDLDLIVGVGDWTDYGWDDAFDAKGSWTRGPLRGFVYLILNQGSSDEPRYDAPVRIEAGGRPLEVFGMPSPNLADMDGDGDLDMVCGEFLDRLSYFENVGDRKQPRYAAPRFLEDDRGLIHLDLQMIVPVALDWDGDGDVDLVVGEEDGRVAYIEHTGRLVDGVPRFARPRYFQQEADEVKFGALVTPFAFDWDADGDEDLICGNSAGYVGFIENLDGGDPPRWAAPRYLEAGGKVIRIQAGPNGSIQGPAEAKWGYTTLGVADWDSDGRADLVVNSIWGELLWYRNVGSREWPVLAAAVPIEVSWPGTPPKPAWNWWQPRGRQLVTQWRTTPVVVDFDRDGLDDLVMLDHEGFLALFPRRRTSAGLELLPAKRIFVGADGAPLQLSRGDAGKSGRRKLAVTDWDGDGQLDVLIDGANAEFLKGQARPNGSYALTNRGAVGQRDVSGHSTSPTVVDWNRDGIPDLLVGAEDGFLYYMRRGKAE